MDMFSHLWQHIAEFFLEWETFRIKVVEKTKKHILCSITFTENRAVYEIEEYGAVRAGAGNMAPTRGTLDK
jgi:hypothetical protein